jgi:hypothetical protein
MLGGHPLEVPLTKEEKSAIASLKRLASRWPESLWLFSNGMSVTIMRSGRSGEAVTDQSGAMDQEYIVGSVNIPNDGGDW